MRALIPSLLLSISTTALAQAPTERLTGAIHYLGGQWPIRIDLTSAERGVAHIAFPALGMSGMEIAAQRDDETLTLDIPFGLGEQHLAWTNNAYRTDASPDERDAIAVILEADSAQPPHITDVEFTNDGLILQGAIWTPAGATAPSPLVIIGHGANPVERAKPEYQFWADHLTRRGYAVFLYDKRGVGESEGEYETASIAQVTGDFIAAVSAATSQSGVDPTRIAFLGGSQFGWIAFAAAQQVDVSAMVLVAPPAVDPVTNEVRVLADELRAAGLTGDNLADAVAYVRLYFAATRHPSLFDDLVAIAESAADTTWIDHVPVPAQPTDYKWWGDNATFDPTESIATYTGAAFIAYGWEDETVSPQLNAHRMQYLLNQTGADATIWLADEADHRLEVPAAMIDGAFSFPQLAPGFLDHVDAFLDEHLAN